MTTVTLPYPLSANKYWRPVTIAGHSTIVPTKEAKAFKRDVAIIARAGGMRKPITGRVAVEIQLYPQRPQDWKVRQRKFGASWDDDVRCIDLDNARKVLYDALKGVAFDDDKWIWRDHACRMEPDALGARVVVTVTALEPPPIRQVDLLGELAPVPAVEAVAAPLFADTEAF